MKEFIKTHPWRLEIVPFLMFAFTAIIPWFYRADFIALMCHSRHFVPSKVWIVQHLQNVFTIMMILAMGSIFNHAWARGERSKKFNYFAVVFPMAAGMM